MKTNFNLIDIERCLLENKVVQAFEVLDYIKGSLTETQYEIVSNGILEYQLRSSLEKQKENEKIGKKIYGGT